MSRLEGIERELKRVERELIKLTSEKEMLLREMEFEKDPQITIHKPLCGYDLRC